ncbi:Uncharacterized protein APZ42_029827 [Daphnia magna]|uniref:Uncharacterized protein n=1 Tax=Daphnia magna TaxID=35525 RepID=A0A164PA61_9CRUS|nr:Uncharacterized protein APZ42_029827 [Daphnia magna]
MRSINAEETCNKIIFDTLFLSSSTVFPISFLYITLAHSAFTQLPPRKIFAVHISRGNAPGNNMVRSL